jgi:spoIIIJ-associated protein
MSDKRASLEIIAPSVEEAIAKGLEDLGLPENAVEVDVLDPGSRGLFGLGSRQARVRLTIRSFQQEESSEPVRYSPAVQGPAPVVSEPVQAEAEIAMPERVEVRKAAVFPTQELDEEEETVLRVARETVSELLEKMKVRAQVNARYGEPDEAHSKTPVMVDVRGDDLSILIGPRAETLNSLQYISNLIVGKELGRSVPLIVDVEGYRLRREQQIRQLARRMADQAVKTGRRQVLEPMPASERRLIHIELRSNPMVTTESIGEDPRRKVTILPKSSS